MKNDFFMPIKRYSAANYKMSASIKTCLMLAIALLNQLFYLQAQVQTNPAVTDKHSQVVIFPKTISLWESSDEKTAFEAITTKLKKPNKTKGRIPDINITIFRLNKDTVYYGADSTDYFKFKDDIYGVAFISPSSVFINKMAPFKSTEADWRKLRSEIEKQDAEDTKIDWDGGVVPILSSDVIAVAFTSPSGRGVVLKNATLTKDGTLILALINNYQGFEFNEWIDLQKKTFIRAEKTLKDR